MEIYALTDPRDGATRYIGKAKDAKKRLKGHLDGANRGNTPIKGWLRELKAAGLKPAIVILAQCTEETWAHLERSAIAAERAINSRLLNSAPGGNQPGEPSDQLLHRLWLAKKRFMLAMPRKGFSEDAKVRMRARARLGYEHIFNEDGSIVPGARYDDGTLIDGRPTD